MKLQDIIRQVNNDTDGVYSNSEITDWCNRCLDELSSISYKTYTHLDSNELEDIPDLDTLFHDLLILYATFMSQYKEEEPQKQSDALGRYEQRKQQFIRYVNRTYSPPVSITDVYEVDDE